MPGIKSGFAAIGLLALLSPDAAAQGVAFLPIPGQFNDGVYLNVTPVVSADRRYVRLGVTPQFNALNGFQTIPVPAAVGGGGNGGGLGGGGLGGLGGAGGGGLGGVGGGGFRNQGIGNAPTARRSGASPSRYRMGGTGAFGGASPAGMTGGMDPLAESVYQQRVMAAAMATAPQGPRPAASSATSRTTSRRSR